jgi:hypothetical protein
MSGFSKLLEPQFQIAGATFSIRKANAEVGFEILEKIRAAIADPTAISRATREDNTEREAGAELMKAVMSISPEKVKGIRQDLFALVDVKLPNTDRFVPLNEVKALIMDLIEPLDNYEIIVRAVAVNFTKSFRGLLSRLGLDRATDRTQDS